MLTFLYLCVWLLGALGGINSEEIKQLKLKSAFITGANRGLGFEFVRQLSKLDDPPEFIFATYRNESTNQALKDIRDTSEKTKVILVKMDVRELEQIEAAKEIVKEHVGEDGLNLLINNAGIAQTGPFPDITLENLLDHYKTNTAGPVMVLQTLYPLLVKAAECSESNEMSMSRAGVISITSMTSSIQMTGVEFVQDFVVPGYKMSKTGLNMGMRVIAAQEKEKGVLIVNIEPGWVRTDMGGPDGEISPEESIGDMLSTMAELAETNHGTFVSRFGELNPY